MLIIAFVLLAVLCAYFIWRATTAEQRFPNGLHEIHKILKGMDSKRVEHKNETQEE